MGVPAAYSPRRLMFTDDRVKAETGIMQARRRKEIAKVMTR